MRRRGILLGGLAALAVAATGVFLLRPATVAELRALMQAEARHEPDVIFVPTPPAVVQTMLKVARVTSDDLVIDLGSGDGRVVIAAATDFGARGVGVEIDPELIQTARHSAERAGVADRVQFLQEDLFQTDISKATVVTLYLMPNLNLKLRSRLLRELKPGTRVVSHAFDMGDWQPDQTLVVEGRHVYFWVIPDRATSSSNQ
jgi:SAM-dependent methyltransferase